jgi:ferric hydroxamate transport system substrate-binding protein
MNQVCIKLVNPDLRRRRLLAGLALGSLLSRFARSAEELRVACLDWALTETMLALGSRPIAIVAASDWNRFVVEPPLPPGVADLGLQQDINLELLATLKPDLILTSPFITGLDSVLQRIAPTLQFSIFQKSAQPLAQPRMLARDLGKRLGKAVQATRYLESAEQQLDAYRTQVAALRPLPVLLVSFIDGRHVRVYGGEGLFQNVFDRIGITNAWTGDSNYWGFTTVGIERLATDRNLQLIALEPVPPDALPTLRYSPLWSRLPFVKAGQVTTLPPVLMFGALPSALRFARLVVPRLKGQPA